MYVVIDRQTNKRANSTNYKTRKAASRAVDRLDLKHGSYRYNYVTLESYLKIETPAPNVIFVQFGRAQ